MRLRAITLENFRSYGKRAEIPIDDLTVFVGRNDAGKSTILEALEIFFNSASIKMQPDDVTKDSGSGEVRIGCILDDLPSSVVLDSDAPTSLADEHLLNADGRLEIIKTFKCAKTVVPGPVHLRAVHPTVAPYDSLIRKSIKELRAEVAQRGLGNGCNLSENPSMRAALYASATDLGLEEGLVQIDDAKDVWSRLQSYLPEYGLFQADRACTVDDSEIQDPMKLAVKEAIAEIGDRLAEIQREVEKKTRQIADATVEKLSETHPDLAAELNPRFKPPTWANVFKIDLDDEAGIPVNKRGSGVRRLILLSFFRARAERARSERAAGRADRPRLILGVEEPEAAQHPDSQHVILESLRAVADSGDQVLLTTHEPAIAGLVSASSLRYVDKVGGVGSTIVRWGSDEILEEVADSLGVLPDPLPKALERLAAAVVVEGPNDVDALLAMARTLSRAGKCAYCGAEDCPQLFWVIGGGGNLQHWITRRHLDKLGLRQVHIYDSDATSEGSPKKETADRADDVNSRPNHVAFLTRRRNMDNYIDVEVVRRVAGGAVLPLSVDEDPRFAKMDYLVTASILEPRKRGELDFADPVDEHGNPLPFKSKTWIARFLMSAHTVDELLTLGEYRDANGESANEIQEWFTEIDACLDSDFCVTCPLIPASSGERGFERSEA
jgi:energy-coupling factor transporter ATP-binding protein EcfA2